MFTPHRKGLAGWSVSPKVGGRPENGSVARTVGKNSAGGVLGRGKGVIGAEAPPPPPPQASLADNEAEVVLSTGDGGGSDDWNRFRESGLLDEKVLLKKDKEALLERVSMVERERDDCLYNMGLLLIEKKEWSSQIEELRRAILEAEEILKREQNAHLIAFSELEKREENLKNALGVEKHCVADLEKALREMRSEIAESKFTSEKKLVDARALEAILEEKQLEIEAKMHTANAKLAEANRKSSEMDRKIEDIEARERKLQREHLSLITERKAHENDVSKQRNHLLEWEKELQEKQRRLLEEQRLLNEREERANSVDAILKKKEVDIEEAHKKIDASRNALKSDEDDFKERLRDLTIKEKVGFLHVIFCYVFVIMLTCHFLMQDAELKMTILVKKEKELVEKEEKLKERENEEIQKLVNEHNATMDVKKQEFEVEMMEKRRNFDQEAKRHLDSLEEEKKQVRCKAEHVTDREKALEIEIVKLRSNEKDLDTKSKALKNWEDSLNAEERRLRVEKEHLIKDSQELATSRDQLSKEKLATIADRQKIILEKENLRVTEEEREQHLKLQSELKLEKEEYYMLKESLEQEKEALKQERELFERDWEVLDERKMAFEAEVNCCRAEREKFEKWQHNEEVRLKNVDLQAKADMHKELEDLRLRKEAFEKLMEHERSEACAVVDRARADMSREFEDLEHELKMNFYQKQEDMEKILHDKENEFERWREVEQSHIRSSSESLDLKLKKFKMEQDQLQRERAEFLDERRRLEDDRLEIQNDIDTLTRLSKNLKDQREDFAKEKERFLLAAEKCKTCHNCGVQINIFDLLDLQQLQTNENTEEIILPSLAVGFLEEQIKGKGTVISHDVSGVGSTNSGSRMSRWLQKCSSLLKISPKKHTEPLAEDQPGPSFGERLDTAAIENGVDYEPAPSANHSFENLNACFGSGAGGSAKPERVDEAEASFGVVDSSLDVVHIQSDNGAHRTSVEITIDNNEVEGSSMRFEDDSQRPEPSENGRRHQPSRRAKSKPIRRNRSVKEVVKDAKDILGESCDFCTDEGIAEESQGVSVQPDQVATSIGQKRRLTEPEPESSEALSESVSLGGRRKRRQTSTAVPSAPSDKRYNLRRSTVASRKATTRAVLDPKYATNTVNLESLTRSKTAGSGCDGEKASCDDIQPTDVEKPPKLLQKSAVRSVSEALGNPSENVVQLSENQEVHEDAIDTKSAGFSEQTAEDSDEVNGAAPTDTATPPPNGDSGSESEDDDGDDPDKRNASIGKKIWNFLTT
ncbi:Putative nuclear matrix constituent protein 1-like protein [Apostasia shenzhenica]|uniref:Nuclear matrix constituent protein 1-like protein n=1 Tax=Apostasia shenzhenica TaxID=1088818 RepID=A0A2I0AE83_9ASPA|nr:Putative nuclear matrix constituent protein 1-like protein [Apostasia shenzhenica]